MVIGLKKLCQLQIQRLLLIMGIMVAVVVVVQLFALPYENYLSILTHASKSTMLMPVGSTFFNSSNYIDAFIVHGEVNSTNASNLDEEAGFKSEAEGEDKDNDFAPDYAWEMDNSLEIVKDRKSRCKFTFERDLTLDKSLTKKNIRCADDNFTREKVIKSGLVSPEQIKKSDRKSTRDDDPKASTYPTRSVFSNQSGLGSLPLLSPGIFTSGLEYVVADSSVSSVAANMSTVRSDKHDIETQHKDIEQTASVTLNNNSRVLGNSIARKRGMKPTSISHMTSLLLQTSVSINSMRPRSTYARDRELLHARLQIENAPITRNTPGLHASLFRNVSMFKRSYELMERMLKVYIYREGEKPIFHQSHLRGIYASEGWFMKLMEGNKQFVVRDPRKAHLFYLPFSSQKLRSALHEQNFASYKDLERHLNNYVDMIAKRYRFWNRTSGADHFLVACHDWAPRFTRNNMGSCIRALCNSNFARGFKIGKDVSLPVTYVRKSQDPLKDLGGNPPSERPILAFFAGGMHGYLRPTLLQHWNNKEPDMKIFGPMPRDIEGKTRYRELMKSSKYCICARGYEVHTPRVVESIYYECVPVIISDNYVPPFFEVLDWEAFSVYILEDNIPNLRNILLSIPEEKYLAMQHRVKMVQQHFLWHKQPVKYDLFHMILHSVWYNRVFQVKSG